MRILSIFYLIIIMIGCGPKKKVEKYETPKSILFVNPKVNIPIFKELSISGKKLELKENDSVSITSKVTIQRKDDKEEVYYESICPDRLTKECQQDSIYINEKNILDIKSLDIENNKKDLNNFVLIEDHDTIDRARKTRDWVLDPGNNIKEIDVNAMIIILSNDKSKDSILQRIEEILFVFQIIESKGELKDENRLGYLKKKYKLLSNKENIELKGIQEAKDSLLKIEEQYRKKLISGFPMRSETYKGLVDRFNKIKKIPYIQEEIFQRVLSDSIYLNDRT
ncbi:MAG: hypothetical protein KDK36_09990, partial [Leptospiraceae bacterium]|nr:hypothetical protein [Leptospiraceae bacterium]